MNGHGLIAAGAVGGRKVDGGILILGLEQASEGNNGGRIGAEGDIDLFEVFGINAEGVKVLHVGFEVFDDSTGVGKTGTLVGGNVVEVVALEVETVFEGVLVAWLGAAFAFGVGKRLVRGLISGVNGDEGERIGGHGILSGSSGEIGGNTCGLWEIIAQVF